MRKPILIGLLLTLLSACAGPRLVTPTTKAQLPAPRVVEVERTAPSMPRDILCDT